MLCLSVSKTLLEWVEGKLNEWRKSNLDAAAHVDSLKTIYDDLQKTEIGLQDKLLQKRQNVKLLIQKREERQQLLKAVESYTYE